MSVYPASHRLSPIAHWSATLVATLRAQILIGTTYPIAVIRAPFDGVLFFLTIWITYQVSGQPEVAGMNMAGFLVIGLVGVEAWGSTIWGSGFAIQHERNLGTIGALFLSPASRAAVIVGYGVGGFIWSIPSLLVLVALGIAAGARFVIADPLAVLLSLVAVYLGSLAVGFALASAFVLSRRGGLLANALQYPVWLLAGFIVPRSSLPELLQWLSNLIPAAHSVDALRQTTLTGASLATIAPSLVAAVATSTGFWLLGTVGLRGVERQSRRTGTLELY